MYYYDAVTRETSWVRPTAANVITQQELEALAAAEKAEASNKPADAASNNTGASYYIAFISLFLLHFYTLNACSLLVLLCISDF